MSLPAWEFDTPIVMLIFNRPDTTSLVFDAVRRLRPRQLFLVADGPRAGREGEAERCREARAIVTEVDWQCEVYTDFASANLGCMRRVSSGVDWVFGQVDEAIILEDDCLPHPTFFPFCRELLDRYRHEPRVAQIAGVNFQFGHNRTGDSYYFSRYNHVWGWATWKRAWLMNDNEMVHWPACRESGMLNGFLADRKQAAYWSKVLDLVAAGAIDSWACRWTLSCWRHGLLTVIPAVNLVSNIGFGPGATHTPVANRYAAMPVEPMPFPLRHPAALEPFTAADRYTLKTQYREYPLIPRVLAALRIQWRKLWGRE
ncbi:glycosyltransferase family 2 protein [Geomonas anaerohicana]|uniref:Glycosyltransferase family 2 protein n=1 Tax=Geomonas anaerohicana TaxID=2798583 RepID=A0ABS0YHQ8_9BACT|nr:glycosyltransferase family 2 protein [Geomonas anaerohicana]MBJ6751459.1 glycosyltransferase family 2 protein [Geomonas anaerohicana]